MSEVRRRILEGLAEYVDDSLACIGNSVKGMRTGKIERNAGLRTADAWRVVETLLAVDVVDQAEQPGQGDRPQLTPAEAIAELKRRAKVPRAVGQ